MKSAMIQEWLIQAGVPGIKGVWADEAGGGRMFVVVSVEQAYCGHSRQVGLLTAQSPAAAYLNRWVVVVDHDVDPTDLSDVPAPPRIPEAPATGTVSAMTGD